MLWSELEMWLLFESWGVVFKWLLVEWCLGLWCVLGEFGGDVYV